MTFVLCILDGWGYSKNKENNAIAQARTPNFDTLMSSCPNTLLECSGAWVGLPDGQMGNSEVGHITIGSGRVIYQDLPKIDLSIKNGSLALNPVIKRLRSTSKRCHIIGLISDGGVHSHINHLIEVSNILASSGVTTFVHGITDGRDVAPKSALMYIQKLTEHGINLATIMGRFYAMDRDKRWQRTKAAYDAIALANGESFSNAKDLIEKSYSLGVNDEFIVPCVHKDYKGFEDGDDIIICNFRADRVRQISHALVDPNFKEFPKSRAKLSSVIGMTQYSDELAKYMDAVFKAEIPQNTLGQVISQNKMSQLRASETEKYAHVTYFFNGGREEPFEGEDRVMIASPKVETYDMEPQMSAEELTNKIVGAISSDKYHFICVNYANPDMVGHSGNMAATIKAVEKIDECLGRIVDAVSDAKGQMLVTADHGNAEQMYDEKNNSPMTSHSMNPVPLIYYGHKQIHLKKGGLSNIAPTILKLMGINIPKDMDKIIIDE